MRPCSGVPMRGQHRYLGDGRPVLEQLWRVLSSSGPGLLLGTVPSSSKVQPGPSSLSVVRQALSVVWPLKGGRELFLQGQCGLWLAADAPGPPVTSP